MLRITALAGLALALAACTQSHSLGDGGVDASETGDGAVIVDASRPDAARACSLVGDFRATIDGTVVIFRFRADGTWTAAPEGTDFPPFAARYSTTGNRFRIYNPPEGGSPGCGPDAAGVYTMAFRAGCRSVRFSLVRDTCAERAASLDGMLMTRVP
ncbi:MAG: hypothetical protein GXP55_21150 [Deltaproteobacteria bacterium]|nr:hypothetical protein [Deltaproteobacteria bacterium]